jgi:hypothetical protein
LATKLTVAIKDDGYGAQLTVELYEIKVDAKICQASADLAIRESVMYVFSPRR